VLVRIAYVADLPTPDEALKMLEQNGGSSPVPTGNAAQRSAPVGGSSSMQPPPRTSAPRGGAEPSARPQISEPLAAAQSAPALKLDSFAEVVALAAEKRDIMTKAALEADVRLVRIEDGRLELALERSAARTFVNDLSRKLEQWTGRRWTVIVSNEAGQPTLRSQAELQRSQLERAAESDPRVKEVLARFPGAKVVEVRKLAAEPPESAASGDDLAEFPDSDDP
jgi:DNA polymerase-3 subunit gamma/tau